MKSIKPVVLVVLDGWGYLDRYEYNAIAMAQPKMFNYFWNNYPHTLLKASGTAVGLPVHTVGNSEVGHITLGAGKIIEQPLTIINRAIKNKTFFYNSVLVQHLKLVPKNKKIHCIGLVSDGNVHSSQNHLYALLESLKINTKAHVCVHAFLDGRDVPAQSAGGYMSALEKVLKKTGGILGSLSGRFYAMDRDNNWERTYKVFAMLTQKKKQISLAWQTVVQQNYHNGIFDEFIEPTLLDSHACIENGDGLLFFNIRPERIDQIVSLFVKKKFIDPAWVITMVPCSKQYGNAVLFDNQNVSTTLLDTLYAEKKTCAIIAETEKFAHVTYFFNGRKEINRSNETRILIPSYKEKTYEDNPEMSAQKITDAVVDSIKNNPRDFYLINYANADMVGHSGNISSTIKAIRCLDSQLSQLYECVVKNHEGFLIVTADHGNAESMWDNVANTLKTSHSNNRVPFIVVEKNIKNILYDLPLTGLKDVAPFIINYMKIR